MVRAFAGDSTMTRRVMGRDSVTTAFGAASHLAARILRADAAPAAAQRAVSRDRRGQLAGGATRLQAARHGERARAGRRVRPRREPRLELRRGGARGPRPPRRVLLVAR